MNTLNTAAYDAPDQLRPLPSAGVTAAVAGGAASGGTAAAGGDAKTCEARSEGARWRDECNWCRCANGVGVCTRRACVPGECLAASGLQSVVHGPSRRLF